MQTNARALAVAVWPESVNQVVKTGVLVLAGTAILALSAKIQVPFWPVPMTLQTFAVMAIAAAYGSRLAVATVIAYLIEGTAGLPVFATGAGLAYIAGPTGGFLIGFIALAGIVGEAADRGWDRSIPKLFAAMVVADVVVFALGFIWLAWFATFSAAAMQKLSLAPGSTGAGVAFAWKVVTQFVLADLLKIALAALFIPACWGLVGKR